MTIKQFFKSKTNRVALALLFVGQIQNTIGGYEAELGLWFPFVSAGIAAAMMILRTMTSQPLSEK